MSLTASMWTSVSGLLTHGEKMNVIGNNIANVNTVGFKASRMDFADFVHQDISALGGPAQVGRGVTIGAIFGDFSQGAFETSTEATDIAISGNGFFRVVPKQSEQAYYTRAGNFRFDSEGYLVDPHGYVLQGWGIESSSLNIANMNANIANNSNSRIKGTGMPQDVKLENFSCPPKHTDNVTMAVNLDSVLVSDKSLSAANPFFGMFEKWDTTPNAAGELDHLPLGQESFAYQQTITVYDEGGTAHSLTVYFDQVTNQTAPNDVNNLDTGKRYWEYVVTMDPTLDQRIFPDGEMSDEGKSHRGLLMTGTLTFDTKGQIIDQSAYVPTSAANMDDLSTWVAAPLSSNGFPMMAPNFSGRPNASEIWSTNPTVAGPGTLNPETSGYLIELNLGMRNKSTWWTSPTGATSVTADAVGKDGAQLMGVGASGERQATTSTSFAGDGNLFYERFAKQNGYTFGELTGITVSTDGVLSGRYSNGVTLELFQITLYDFPSKTNLKREGGNLFSQTRESGDPASGAAGTGSLGMVYSNAIEQSNVDLAREFVQMITTQRGFQANSKSITTTDTMLDTVINMKR